MVEKGGSKQQEQRQGREAERSHFYAQAGSRKKKKKTEANYKRGSGTKLETRRAGPTVMAFLQHGSTSKSFQNSPQTVPATGDQVLEYLNLWETFMIPTSTDI